MIIKKHVRRIASIVMASVMLMSVTSCNLRAFRSKIISDPITPQELARLMITAINNKKNAPDVYSSIPEVQRDGLSYSYFIQYVDIMSRISGENGDISAFRMLSDEEVSAVTEYQDNSFYGNLIGVEFLYDSEDADPVYIIMSEDSSGMAYLSEEWITESIDIYNYGEHYFQLIYEPNLEGLFTLLRPGLDELFTDDAVNNMAQEYIDYYRLRVRTPREEFHIVTLLPEHMCIEIPETVNSRGSRVLSHYVDFYLSDDSYDIEDILPSEPDLSLLTVSGSDTDVEVTCGEDYTSSQLYSMLGDITGYTFYYESSGLLSISYGGMVMIFETEEYVDNDSWSGQLISIRIVNGLPFSIGQDIYVGMDKMTLLEIYPFLFQDGSEESSESETENDVVNQGDITIELRDSSVRYEIELSFDQNDCITMIKIEKE